MDITQSKLFNNVQAYRGVFEQFVTEASFLWLLRSVGLSQPHYSVSEIAELEGRITVQLDGLMTSIDLGWESCEAALVLGEPGELFTSAVVAFRSHETHKIQTVVQTGLSEARASKGLISALGWLETDIVAQWIVKFLNGKDLNHKYLGVAACSVRRQDPGEILTTILKREDCLSHAKLHARALRLIGELRRLDLMSALQNAADSQEPSIAFWANWSTILLGQHAVVKNLQPQVFNRGPFQARAIQIAFRVLPIEQAREWISTMAKDPAGIRAVIAATGVLGDPHAVNWLIAKMADPLLARLAAESFTNITGVDLVKHQLHEAPHFGDVQIPNDDADDAHVGMDEDENLPWPDVEKVTALWRNHGANFVVGRRYFLGKPISPELLKRIMTEGSMRQRHAAALELALIDPSSRLINTCAKVAS
jgi:uncharacterized protein (TIGR02270 family)